MVQGIPHQSADRARKQIVLQLGLETLDVDKLRSSTASVCPIDPWHSLCGHNDVGSFGIGT
jgi:hypothetical protein